jgi:exodeoxyribonuclease V alpha subunit
MSLFDELWRSGALRPLDHALGQSLRRLDRDNEGDVAGADADDQVLAAASLASLAVAHGHAAFDPSQPQRLISEAGIDWPDAAAWRERLAGSHWVSTPDADEVAPGHAPLVLEQGLLYLRRYREYERRLAAGLLRIARQPTAAVDAAALAPLFSTLFPASDCGDAQARAAALSLLRPLLLVTGGPGTGKTTTVTRILLLLIEQARQASLPLPRIALAAPTGRAAERMARSLHQARADLEAAGVEPMLCDALPHSASTLHRLLGSIPGSTRFRHDADHRLPLDIMVIDEASMVDLPLLCKLVEAVAEGARLILIGDRDQLPSVEAGDVLSAIVDAAGEETPFPTALRPLFGDSGAGTDAIVSAADSQLASLRGHRVELQHTYRQSDALNLAPLAAAVREGGADRTLAMLRRGELAGVHFHEDVTDPLHGTMRASLLDVWRELAAFIDPSAALTHASRLRLLTALRDGPQGAAPLNARIEEALAGTHRDPYFHGRLVMVTENSHRTGLFNGDIGVCLRDADGASVVWFDGAGQGDVRGFHPSALPAHAGAFATTVHKAQGSEFSSTWLLLPQHDARPLSRQLLYTAMTRSREVLHICASEGILRSTLARNVQRISGLSPRLNTQVATTQG